MSQCISSQAKINRWIIGKLPDSSLDFSLDITDSIDPASDFVQVANVSVSPSGAGEMVPTTFTITNPVLMGVQHTILTVNFASGQQNRETITKFIVTMVDARVFEFVVYMDIPIIVPGLLPTVPPSDDFGTPIVGTFDPGPRNYLLITAAVLNQATVDGILTALAALTPGYTGNIIDLSQVGTSPPSAPGIAAATTLVNAGNTVFTNH